MLKKKTVLILVCVLVVILSLFVLNKKIYQNKDIEIKNLEETENSFISPDKKYQAIENDDSLQIVDNNQKVIFTLKNYFNPEDEASQIRYRSYKWSPDSKKLLIAKRFYETSTFEIILIDESNKFKKMDKSFGGDARDGIINNCCGASWSPDSSKLALFEGCRDGGCGGGIVYLQGIKFEYKDNLINTNYKDNSFTSIEGVTWSQDSKKITFELHDVVYNPDNPIADPKITKRQNIFEIN